MRHLIALVVMLVSLSGLPAEAGIGNDPPTNPCPENKKLKTNLGILNVSGDGSLGAGACANSVLAETVIVCTSKEKTKSMDVAIEYYDHGGSLMSGALAIGTNTFCAVPPGETLTFHTVPPGSDLPPGWASTGSGPGFIPTTATLPVVLCSFGTTGCFLQGSARVMATSNKLQCTAMSLDISGICGAGLPGPVATKELTIITKAKQKGD